MNNSIIKIFIDESGHLVNNGDQMALGCIWGSPESINDLSIKVKEVKQRHSIAPFREIKWTKVGNKKADYYKDLVNVFFETAGVNYRAVVIDKKLLKDEVSDSIEDDFYYKTVYLLVRNIVEKKGDEYKIFLDYKDTWSDWRSKRLVEYLDNTQNFHRKKFNAQPVRSYESTPLQIADLLNGALMFTNKKQGDESMKAKQEIAEFIKEKSSMSLNDSTAYSAEKINILFWEPKY